MQNENIKKKQKYIKKATKQQQQQLQLYYLE